MSLLYQALLKNNQNKPVVSENENQIAQQNTAKHSDLLTSQPTVATSGSYQSQQFAGSHSGYGQNSHGQNHLPWFIWIFIASLVLIVGLLAGYIYGNFMWSNNAVVNTPAPIVTELTEDAVNTKANPKANQLDVITKEEQPKADPTIEVAVNSEGQVVSKVTNTPKQTPAVTDASSQNVIDDVDLTGVPNTLKASFAEAIKATEIPEAFEDNFEMNLSSSSDVLLLDDLTVYQTALLPNIIYQMHIFSSDVSERWVKINDKVLYEGQELQSGLTLLEIRQDMIVWRFNNRKVGQLALVDFVQ
jgi:SpoU rRNA methylase family enzyme